MSARALSGARQHFGVGHCPCSTANPFMSRLSREHSLRELADWLTSLRSRRADLLKCLLHSHSMVPGGLLVMSNATRLTPGTSLMMRLLTFSSRSYGRRAQSAVIASSEVTARITIG